MEYRSHKLFDPNLLWLPTLVACNYNVQISAVKIGLSLNKSLEVYSLHHHAFSALPPPKQEPLALQQSKS